LGGGGGGLFRGTKRKPTKKGRKRTIKKRPSFQGKKLSGDHWEGEIVKYHPREKACDEEAGRGSLRVRGSQTWRVGAGAWMASAEGPKKEGGEEGGEGA